MKRIFGVIKQYDEMIRYVLVGGLTTVVSLGTYYGCVSTFLDATDSIQLQIANIISWIASVTFAYFTNRKYVFKSKAQDKLREASAFFASRISTLLLDMGCMFILVTAIGMNDRIAKILVQFIILITNYILSKYVVFKKTKEKEEANK